MCVTLLRAQRLPYCCGVIELGSFDESPGTLKEDDIKYYDALGIFWGQEKTYKKAWKLALKKSMTRKAPYIFCFKREVSGSNLDGSYTHRSEYTCHALREVVMKLPGAVCVAPEHINTNSHNLIEVWKVFNTGELFD